MCIEQFFETVSVQVSVLFQFLMHHEQYITESSTSLGLECVSSMGFGSFFIRQIPYYNHTLEMMSQNVSVLFYSYNGLMSQNSLPLLGENLYNLAIVLDHAMSQNSQARKRGENSRLYRRRRRELEIFSAAGVIFKRV